MAQLPTVGDVASAAGVSRQTVSNVLNTPSIVRPATRSRVEAAIERLGYRPHASARRLRTRKSSTIGIRLEPVRNGISGAVLDVFLHALTEGADARGLRVLLYTATDAEHEIEQMRRLRDGADVDALVLTSTERDDPRVEWLTRHQMPFASFGRPWGADDMDAATHAWVDVDGRAGTREATEHLIGLGARRVGHIGWPDGSGAGDDRRRGWLDALRDAALDPAELLARTEDGVASGMAAALALLGEASHADALVCASDTLALGASMAATSLGRPDLPITGFDDTSVAAAVGFSSVRQPIEESAAGVLDLLLGPEASDGTASAASAPASHEPANAPSASAGRHLLLAPRLVARGADRLARTPAPGPRTAVHRDRKDPS